MKLFDKSGKMIPKYIQPFLSKAYKKIIPAGYYAQYGRYGSMQIVGIQGNKVLARQLDFGGYIVSLNDYTMNKHYHPEGNHRYLQATLNSQLIEHIFGKNSKITL